MVSTIFSCIVWSFVSALGRNVYGYPLPIFFSKLVCPFIIELEEFFVYSRWESLIGYMICKRFLSFLGLLFTFWMVSFR